VECIDVSFTGGKCIEAKIGDYVIKTDQPIKYGGLGSAPAPFDLFLASLATCAGIFAWNFCESRQIPTDGISLRMECLNDTKSKMISQFKLVLKLPENFPDRYQEGIIRAMELCAVKKHMQNAPEFLIEIDD
jgi:ribosomal protein S12 methylthiotransferase accessory factor